MKAKIILAACVFIVYIQNANCQRDNQKIDTASVYNDGVYYTGYSSIEDSIYYYFSTYYKVHLDIGFSKYNDFKLSSFSRRFYTNISYSISSFVMPLGINPSQVGLYSELGLTNISLYLNFGPIARMDKNFYLIPYCGIGLIPFPKYKNENLAFIYYLGVEAGFNIDLNNNTALTLELASDFLKLKKDGNNIYFKIGVDFNLFYAL